jgi:hypothetical protein
MKIRGVAFVVFWLFAAISAAWVAFQMASSAGLWVGFAQSIAGLVFALVVLGANRPDAMMTARV